MQYNQVRYVIHFQISMALGPMVLQLDVLPFPMLMMDLKSKIQSLSLDTAESTRNFESPHFLDLSTVSNISWSLILSWVVRFRAEIDSS